MPVFMPPDLVFPAISTKPWESAYERGTNSSEDVLYSHSSDWLLNLIEVKSVYPPPLNLSRLRSAGLANGTISCSFAN